MPLNAIALVKTPITVVWWLLARIYYTLYHPIYVAYCLYCRPFPIPGGCVVIPATLDQERQPSTTRPPWPTGGEGSLQTLLDGSQLAHNTHLTCVRNMVPITTNADGDSGGGFFLCPPDNSDREQSATAKAPVGGNGILFETLEDAVLHAHNTAMLLVLFIHAETNATSQTLLSEIIVHNTHNIQSFLSKNCVFYLMSANSDEFQGLAQTATLGHAFPSVLVYNANQPVANGIESQSGRSKARSALRFVSSMEGCGCVGDLLPYLRECEKRYMSWL